MEHDWGRWVTEFGVGDTGCSLASYYLVSGGTGVITNEDLGENFAVIWFIPPDPAITMVRNIVNKYPGFPNFPYGWEVEPDSPV